MVATSRNVLCSDRPQSVVASECQLSRQSFEGSGGHAPLPVDIRHRGGVVRACEHVTIRHESLESFESQKERHQLQVVDVLGPKARIPSPSGRPALEDGAPSREAGVRGENRGV